MIENENPTIENPTIEEATSEPQPVVEKININEIKEELKHQEQERLEEELKDFNNAFNNLVEGFKSLTPEQIKEVIAELKNNK